MDSRLVFPKTAWPPTSIIVFGAALFFVLSPSSDSQGGISGTKHDLSGAGYGTDQICIFCHTPHNANTTVTDSPLWNHALSAVSSYTVYSSSTLNATVGQPDGSSKLCLSCHDGTVAVDSFGDKTGSHFITGDANLGTSLGNDHPISFVYDATLATADGSLFTPNSASYVDAGHKVPLFGSKMQCASCHAVHDNTNSPFLRIANTGSALCLTCHNK